ncbi:MAG: hypothetical protein JSU65_05380 [Candidatus Zixiibacteriota bacterium]|nr:MAG: hypothetical protein JSU65_05380 [candidate division Zixibacteria bacterium]
MLRHFLATLAYRTQKALRYAPENFADFRVKPKVRTPHELIWHMTGVLQYAVSLFADVETWPDQMPTFTEEVDRFHNTLEELGRHLDAGTPIRNTTPERVLQGPFSDAMTHAGQLIMLRRLCGSPVMGEGFMLAAIDPCNLGPDQPDPVSPDEHMREP